MSANNYEHRILHIIMYCTFSRSGELDWLRFSVKRPHAKAFLDDQKTSCIMENVPTKKGEKSPQGGNCYQISVPVSQRSLAF